MGKKYRDKSKSIKQPLSTLIQMLRKIKLGTVSDLFSIVIAGIALFVACQANYLIRESNEISLKQISDQLIISKIIHLGGFITDSEGVVRPDSGTNVSRGSIPDYLFCSHKIRLSNLGESATSLVNFSVRASYMEELAFLEGFGEAITFSKNKDHFSNFPVTDIQSILISEEMSKSTPLDEKWLNNLDNGIDLPIPVPGKSSLDFVVHTIVELDNSDNFFNIHPAFFMVPDKVNTSEKIDSFDGINEGVYPFKMTYFFETAVGQIIATNPLTCWQIGVFEPGTVLNVTPNAP